MEQINAGSVVLTGLVLTGSHVSLTFDSSPSLSAHTLESSNFISTRGSVETRVGHAVVDVGFASGSGETFSALADKLVVQIDAAFCSNRTAWIAETLVDFGFALKTDKSWTTFASEALELIDTGGTVDARIGSAIVDCVLALLASVARLASASVVVDLVGTLAIIATGLAGALVDVVLASWTSPARMTDALVVEELVHANAVQARIAGAKVDLFMTTFSGETRRAVAGEVVH